MPPTVFRVWNLRIVIYPNDHYPPHVHIIGPDAEAKINLETLECMESFGFTEKSLKKIRKFIAERKLTLWETWDEYQE